MMVQPMILSQEVRLPLVELLAGHPDVQLKSFRTLRQHSTIV